MAKELGRASGRGNGWKSWCAGALAVCAGAVALGAAPEAAQAVPIRITYTDGSSEGFNDPTLGTARRRAFEAAASVWGRKLPGSVPIDIEASFDPLGGDANRAVLGTAGPVSLVPGWDTGTPPPTANTYYVNALANNLAGQDINSEEADIRARFNSDLDGPDVFGDQGFYYGLDGQKGINTDFFPVALHELGHGLGFTGLFERDGTSQGAFASFDRLIADGPGTTAGLASGLTTVERSVLFRSGAAYFAGVRARAAGSGRNSKIYAPADFSDGSSLYHTDEATYTGAEELMTPFASGNPHDAGPITYAMFLDLGWGSVGGSTTPTPTPVPTVGPTPTPLPPTSRPANDDFGSAQVLTGSSGRVSGRSTNATREAGEPSHSGNIGGASVWYRWTAPASGRVTFSTSGSSFDTLMAAYVGSQVNSLSKPAQGSLGDDASEVDRTSRVTFDVSAGRVYSIAVDGYADSTGTAQGNVLLSWSLTASAPVGPSNNDFARAQALAGAAGRVAGTTLNANRQMGEPAQGGAGRSVWYRWTAPATRRWTLTTGGSNLDTTLALYTGSVLGSLRRIGFDDDDAPVRTSSVTLSLSAGTAVYIAVDSKGTAGGPFVLGFGLAPANDDASAAQVLAGDSGGVRATTAFASRQAGEPLHAGALGNSSVWYRWTAPANGTATWRTTGSAFDTLLAIYSGTPLSALSRVAFADNDSGVLTGTATFAAKAGTTYWIAIDGKSASNGALALGWSLQRAPSNDLFAGATGLSGASGAASGNNTVASIESGESRHAGVGAGRSVWYRWTAPQTGRATFVAYSPTIRPIVVAYAGSTVKTLANAASQVARDGVSMTIALDAVAGRTYWIAVDSQNIGAQTVSGPFLLRWSLRASQPAA